MHWAQLALEPALWVTALPQMRNPSSLLNRPMQAKVGLAIDLACVVPHFLATSMHKIQRACACIQHSYPGQGRLGSEFARSFAALWLVRRQNNLCFNDTLQNEQWLVLAFRSAFP